MDTSRYVPANIMRKGALDMRVRSTIMKIRHDIHTHTLLSSCCYDPEATISAYAYRARELGHTVFGVSNHLWDEKVPGASKWYHQQMINYGLEGARAAMPSIPGMRLLIGTETEYCGMSDTLGMLAETAKKFDYILVPHTHIHMKNFVIPEMDDVKEMRQKLASKIAESVPELSASQAASLVNSVSSNDIEAMLGERHVDMVRYNADFMYQSFLRLMKNSEFVKMVKNVPVSIAHTFSPCGLSKELQKTIIEAVTDEQYLECFCTARALGVGIEVNTGAFKMWRNDFEDEPMIRVMRLAKAAGCKFTFGTDTHSLAGLDRISRAERISELCYITENDLMDFVK